MGKCHFVSALLRSDSDFYLEGWQSATVEALKEKVLSRKSVLTGLGKYKDSLQGKKGFKNSSLLYTESVPRRCKMTVLNH